MPQIPSILEADVRRELSGERIRWHGGPTPWLLARAQLPAALLGIPFLAFSLFWTYTASSIHPKDGSSHDLFFVLWGSMFILIGLSMVLSPLYKAWHAPWIWYVVGERRALIVERTWQTRIASYPAAAVAQFERHSATDGSGKLVFERRQSGRRQSQVTEIGFLGLAEVAPAERALKEMIEANR